MFYLLIMIYELESEFVIVGEHYLFEANIYMYVH